jgi:hypothetical protein
MFDFYRLVVLLAAKILRNPKPLLKVILDLIGPDSKCEDLIVQFDSIKLYPALVVELIKFS